jgi:hypothetical protein
MFHVEQIGGVSGDLANWQEKRLIFDPKPAIISGFCNDPFLAIFGDFSAIFRRSIFGDQFAAIRLMLSYLDSNSRSFLLRSTVSQFHKTGMGGGVESSFQSSRCDCGFRVSSVSKPALSFCSSIMERVCAGRRK